MSFWYLASPYSSPNESIREERFKKTENATGWLLERKIWTYSPIVHNHQLAKEHSLPTDAKHWEEYNKAMIESARGVILLFIDGWKESKGVEREVDFCELLKKPICFLMENKELEWKMIPSLGESV